MTIDWVFPAVCPGCATAVSNPGDLCAPCWQQIKFITTPFCPIMGTPFSYDQGDDAVCGEALANPPPFRCARAAVVHEGLGRQLVTQLKYGDRVDLAPMLARMMVLAAKDILSDCDLVIPVPLHRWRFIRRYYNQAAELARSVARLAGKEFFPGGLIRSRYTKKQVGLSAAARHRNVRGAFKVPSDTKLANKRVLLVDDVYTTGATLRAATSALIKAKVASVDVLTFSRVLN